MAKARSDALHLAGVFAMLRHERDTARNQRDRQIGHARQGHHHGGQPFVTGSDADDPATSGQRANQAAEDDGGVIAKG